MDIFNWIIFGSIAGFAVTMFDPFPNKGSLLGGMMLGVVGALVGGYMALLFAGNTGFSGIQIVSFVVASISSLALLFLAGALRRV